MGKDCPSSNRHWAGTVHLNLRALLHRRVSQADVLALARLGHAHREQPKRSPGVRGADLQAWLITIKCDYIIGETKVSIRSHDMFAYERISPA